ncbi:MAG: transcriptional regulator [Methanocorpusculum sp.]|nr:transcriptional regulator [Methanocorpusculum sp.]
MVKVPCQEIVWNIIPAIQSALAAELVGLGISQVKVAQALSLAPSAVSQYLSGKRGYRIVFSDDVKAIIANLAEDIKSGKLTEDALQAEFCTICRSIRGEDGCIDTCCTLDVRDNPQ